MSAPLAVQAFPTHVGLRVADDDVSAYGGDSSPTDGIVPAGGEVVFQWIWDATAESGSYSQMLPAGMSWESSAVTSGCVVVGTLMLSCTTHSNESNVATKTARVSFLPNGTKLSTSAIYSGGAVAPITLTVAAAAPTVGLSFGSYTAAPALDPESPHSVPGEVLNFTTHLSTTVHDGSPVGLEPLRAVPTVAFRLPPGAKGMPGVASPGALLGYASAPMQGDSLALTTDSTTSMWIPDSSLRAASGVIGIAAQISGATTVSGRAASTLSQSATFAVAPGASPDAPVVKHAAAATAGVASQAAASSDGPSAAAAGPSQSAERPDASLPTMTDTPITRANATDPKASDSLASARSQALPFLLVGGALFCGGGVVMLVTLARLALSRPGRRLAG